MEFNSKVYLVDDDESIINGLSNLLSSHGFDLVCFYSAQEFLNYKRSDNVEAHCLILDIRMPEMNGLQLHDSLNSDIDDIPIIFLTGHGDIPIAVKSIQKGAYEFLAKPFDPDKIIEVIHSALDHDYKNRLKKSKFERFNEGYKSLTKRELLLLEMILKGLLNKQIAYDLSISEDTVKVHRHNLMKKLGEKSWAKIAVAYEMLINQR